MAQQSDSSLENALPSTAHELPVPTVPAGRWVMSCHSLSVGYGRVGPLVEERQVHAELKLAAVFDSAFGLVSISSNNGRPRELRLVGRQVYCVAPDVEHAAHWTAEAPLVEIFLKPAFLETIPAEHLKTVLARESLDGAAHDPVLWLLATTIRLLCSHRDPPTASLLEPMAACFARRLFTCHGSCYAPLPGSRLSEDRTQLVHDFIEENLDQRIRVAHLAKLVSLSPPHFTLLFRNRTGKAPMDYVREFRRIKAHEMIFSGEHRMGEVADACGFCDEPHLNREFRKFFGYPPKLLRTRGTSSADSEIQ